MRKASLTLEAHGASPHDLSADVRVFGESTTTRPFVSLDLVVGDTELAIFLPPHAYNAARSIADLWPTLADRVSVATHDRVPA